MYEIIIGLRFVHLPKESRVNIKEMLPNLQFLCKWLEEQSYKQGFSFFASCKQTDDSDMRNVKCETGNGIILQSQVAS